MKSEVKKNEDLEDELKLYKALYFREKKRLENIIKTLKDYEYLLPDCYKKIITEIYFKGDIKWHD